MTSIPSKAMRSWWPCPGCGLRLPHCQQPDICPNCQWNHLNDSPQAQVHWANHLAVAWANPISPVGLKVAQIKAEHRVPSHLWN